MGTYKDTVPVNATTKERIKRLQSKVAIIKGLPSSVSQIDLMDIMTVEFEGISDKAIDKLPKQ